MPAKLLRRVLTLLIVTAYVGATMLQGVPRSAAMTGMSHTASGGEMHHQGSPGDQMPCKGMLPGCVGDLGCIFLVSLPAPDLTLVTATVWSSVSYDSTSQGLRGRTVKPALGPPILLA